MKEIIKACSFDEAYDIFLEDHPKQQSKKAISIDGIEDDEVSDNYQGLGFVFYRMNKEPGENVNQTQTKVIDRPGKGTKKWNSQYLVVDRFNSVLIYGTDFKFKKEAVDAAREYTNKYFTSTFILLGKSLEGADRIQAQIDYKPAPSQEDGEWLFIW